MNELTAKQEDNLLEEYREKEINRLNSIIDDKNKYCFKLKKEIEELKFKFLKVRDESNKLYEENKKLKNNVINELDKLFPLDKDLKYYGYTDKIEELKQKIEYWKKQYKETWRKEHYEKIIKEELKQKLKRKE